MRCIVCKTNETEGRNNYCSECFSTAISELDEKYGRASETREDHQEAPASNPE